MEIVQDMPRIPGKGETVVVRDGGVRYHHGGMAVESSVAFSRLGMDVILCARAGDDSFAKRLRGACRDIGIDTRFIAEDYSRPTGIASVMADSDGSRRTVLYPGASAALCAEDVEEAFTSYPDGVFTHLEAPEEAVLAASKYAVRNGLPLFIDAASPSDFPLEKLAGAEMLLANEREAEMLCGIRPETVDTCLKAAVALSKRIKTHSIVLKLGARGAFCYDGKYYNVIPAYKVKAVRSGAGSAFSAAVSSAYLQNGNILAAVKFGCLAGAITISKPQSALPPTLGEIRRFAEATEMN
jgi:ribokinase